MSTPGPVEDALLAVRLFSLDPKRFGGLWVRGGAGPVRDRLLEQLRAWLPEGSPVRRLPLSIDDDRLAGGIDLGASLAAGRPVRHDGLLGEAWNAVFLVQGADRAGDTLAGRLAQARDAGGPALILMDDGVDEAQPPSTLCDRVAFRIDLDGIQAVPALDTAPAPSAGEVEPAEPETLAAIAGVAAALGIDSARAMLFTLGAARLHAGLQARSRIEDEDVVAAARLVLAPRATRMPEPAPPETAQDQNEQRPEGGELPLEDVVLEAVRPKLLPDLIAALAAGRSRARAAGPRGQGARKRALLRGRPVGARAALPSSGLRLALVDTLRAAAPWQALRGRGNGRIVLRKDDLRVRRYEERETVLTVFAVDASGSAAFARLAEAKGAVELMLERAYARRAEVALIAFRGERAELMLPPTRSLTRARRLLADMAGGGATPLAAGLDSARELAEAARFKGRTAQLVVLTDGRANVARSGEQSRSAGTADAVAAAKRIAPAGLKAVVLDIGARPQPEAAALAAAMQARIVHLPRADAAGMAAIAA